MPPHRVYVEPFLGSGALMRRKRPASRNVGIDADPEIIARHTAHARPGFTYLHASALDWLPSQPWDGSELLYCDPPYLGSSRKSARPLYRHELSTEAEHIRLLGILTTLPTMTIVSGYPSPLYDAALAAWNRVTFQAMTRRGLATEVVWFNYPPPVELHDYRFLGTDFHDRCRIGRKIARWSKRLASLAPLERAAILSALGVCSSNVTRNDGGAR